MSGLPTQPLTIAEICAASLAVTIVIELITVALRFGLKLQANTHTRWLSRVTAGCRIHHAYIGVAMLIASIFVDAPSALHNALITFGSGVALSDLVHHYLVLWPITGDPEFCLRYPEAEAESVPVD